MNIVLEVLPQNWRAIAFSVVVLTVLFFFVKMACDVIRTRILRHEVLQKIERSKGKPYHGYGASVESDVPDLRFIADNMEKCLTDLEQGNTRKDLGVLVGRLVETISSQAKQGQYPLGSEADSILTIRWLSQTFYAATAHVEDEWPSLVKQGKEFAIKEATQATVIRLQGDLRRLMELQDAYQKVYGNAVSTGLKSQLLTILNQRNEDCSGFDLGSSDAPETAEETESPTGEPPVTAGNAPPPQEKKPETSTPTE